MDEAGRSHFAVEVEDLDHRISTLRDSITSLHQTFNARKTDMEERNSAKLVFIFHLSDYRLLIIWEFFLQQCVKVVFCLL